MNRLGAETSPYLRQHAANPVDWYPWGDEAFAAAAASDRPILLSIGYSACHWCHVMAHESFEDPDTAALMNRLFVNIKVDREERPDVDAIYMEATVAMTGHGGWPMTVFMTPDRRPFYCGTYFPSVPRGGMPSFAQVCAAIDDAWGNRRDDLVEQAQRITDHLARRPRLGGDRTLPGLDVVDAAAAALVAAHDPVWGGFGGAPKFPQSMSVDTLLRHHRRTGDGRSLDAAVRSLDAMAAGGIWDHLGGGFARYSVDDRWLVPHFEKMLYDNALLIRPYLHAWQVTGDERHLRVVTDTVAYLARDLRHPDGGFFSAEDADSPAPSGRQEEGRFSTWTPDELVDALGDADAATLGAWYGVTAGGNFEGRNILFRPIGGDPPDGEIDAMRARLLAVREARPRPGLDDKVLTEWNALLLASLAEASPATGRADWLALAEALADFLCRELRGDDGRWLRSWQADAEELPGRGRGRHLAYAHDHAALVDGFTRLYEATGHRRWLDQARTTADALIELFWDDEGHAFYTTGHDAEALITRPQDLQDNATPSANSTAASALLRLAPLVDEPRFAAVAESILALLGGVVAEHPLAFANLTAAIEIAGGRLDEVVITGDRPDLLAAYRGRWRPTAVLSHGDRLGGPLWSGRDDGFAYVCRQYTCGLPAADADQLAAQLDRG